MKIVVGLGNPGRQYAATRHNVGWMVVERLADRAGWGSGRERDAARVVWGRYAGLDLALVRPLTFMNDSGVAVRKVLAREHAPLADLLVVCDDFALPFGRLRLREAGSAGGHNGLRSIIGDLGTQGFARLRVGIGAPTEGAIDHVLARFTTHEAADLPAVIEAAADAVEAWAHEGPARAASTWNAWQRHPPESPVASREGPDEAAHPSDPPAADTPDGAGPAHPGPDGIRRSPTGWRRLLPRPPADEPPPASRR